MKSKRGIPLNRPLHPVPPCENGRKPLGRKSRLKEGETLIRLCSALEAGNTYENACAMAGIGRTTFYRWMNEAKNCPLDHQLWDFRNTVKKACAVAENRSVVLIQKAAAHDWRAAAWWLERRNPEEYGRRKVIELDTESNSTAIDEATHQASAAGGLVEMAAIVKRCAPYLLAERPENVAEPVKAR
jgi:hypothetical protein